MTISSGLTLRAVFGGSVRLVDPFGLHTPGVEYHGYPSAGGSPVSVCLPAADHQSPADPVPPEKPVQHAGADGHFFYDIYRLGHSRLGIHKLCHLLYQRAALLRLAGEQVGRVVHGLSAGMAHCAE